MVGWLTDRPTDTQTGNYQGPTCCEVYHANTHIFHTYIHTLTHTYIKYFLKQWSLSVMKASLAAHTKKRFLMVRCHQRRKEANEKADGTNGEKETFLPVQFVLCSAPTMRRNLRARKVGMKK